MNHNLDEYSLNRILDAYCEAKPIDEKSINNISIPAGESLRFNYHKFYSFKLTLFGETELIEYQNKYVLPQLDHQINIDSLKTARDSLIESKLANNIANQSLNEAKTSNELSRKSNKLSKVSIGIAIGSLIFAIISIIVAIIAMVIEN